MKIYTFDGKLVEEVGAAYDHVVFLRVLKDEDKDTCPHCGKPIPTETTEVVSSLNYKSKAKPVATLPNENA